MNRQALIIRNIKPHAYKAGVHEVELAQVVSETRDYPSKRANTGLGDGLMSESDFGFPSNSFTNESTRVAWVAVKPGTTTEQVAAMLKAYPNAGIKRVLSNQPILSSEQKSAIAAGLTTEAIIAFGSTGTGGQLRRYGANDSAGRAGQPILDRNGKQQFAINVFVQDVTASPDVDLRDSSPAVAVAGAPVQQTAARPSAPISTVQEGVTTPAAPVTEPVESDLPF